MTVAIDLILNGHADSLVLRIAQFARNTPEKQAIVCLSSDGEPTSIRFGEFNRDIRQVAAALQGKGLVGERALVMLPTSIEYAQAFYGCLCAGVIAVPAYVPSNGMHAERLARIVADCGARAVITTRKIYESLTLRFERALGSASDVQVVLLEDVFSGVEAEVSFGVPACDHVAYLQYTSGSTGDPRGVMITHGNVLHYVEVWQERFRQDADDVFVSWLPLFHDLGLIMGLLQPLCLGATAVIMPAPAFLQRPLRWLAAVSEYRGTVVPAPNFAYELCCAKIEESALATLDLSRVRVALNGAEPVRAETLRRFAEKFAAVGFRAEAALPSYGLAEATLAVTTTRPGKPRVDLVDKDALRANRYERSDAADAVPLVSCGPALPGLDVRIVQPESGCLCAEGEVGELWLKGPTVAAGYWRRPALSKETFEARTADGSGPFLRTGDLAVSVDGEIFITGRLKDLIIVRGRNHYPQDLEHSAFSAHPLLAPDRAAAFSIEMAGEERAVIAVEVRRSSRKTVDGPEVVRAIRAAIAERHEISPYAILLLQPATIKLTSSGKIQRRACRSAYLEGSLEPIFEWTDEAVPLTSDAHSVTAQPAVNTKTYAEILDWLVTKIAEAKRIERSSIAAPAAFADFGLDSLNILELSDNLSQWLGRPVETNDFFNHPSLHRLSAHLAGQERRGAPEPLETTQGSSEDSVALIGMACRFPGAASLAEYWRLLESGKDAIQEVPSSRWDADAHYRRGPVVAGSMNTKHGGFIEGVDRFDAGFFGISPREARSMDPQQRLLLEMVWHALEDAGIVPSTLAGSNTGVFVGISTYDYRKLQLEHGDANDAYAGTGTALSIAANRVSYFLDLRGPSWAVDTACSSSLVALHHARESLLRGETDLAIVAGVNLILSPDLTVVFSQAQMMAPDGRCKTFDAKADGYGRGEGCGVVVLERQSDAERRGRRIAAVLAGSAVNQDGRSNGLTAPNGHSQEAVIRRALASARVSPGAVSYVEAHGTGTVLGDPIEVSSIKAVYGEPSGDVPTLWLGSAKTNIGHLEAAAGVAGVIKVALAMNHGRIPAHLHLRELNPAISFHGSRCVVPRRTLEWDTQGSPRVAGISSFGFGGTNAHVVLREAGEAKSSPAVASELGWELLPISAKSAASLRGQLESYAAHLTSAASADFTRTCRSAQRQREHFTQRTVVLSDRGAHAAQLLERYLRGERPDDVFTGASDHASSNVAFLFTGQGAQYAGMGAKLYDGSAVFHEAMDRCDALLRPLLGESILDVMFAPGGDETLGETHLGQPALFALEYALYRVLSRFGVTPQYLIGHSLGEYVAACVAGVFSLEDGLTLVAHRGRLMQATSAEAGMCAVSGDLELVGALLEPNSALLPPGVALAAHNCPSEVVISGRSGALSEVTANLRERGAKVTPLRVKRAFHSPLMDGMLDEFASIARRVQYRAPRLPIVSNLSGDVADDSIATPDYWIRHVREPVRFARGVEALVQRGCRLMVEVGPQPILSALGEKTVSGVRWIPTLRRSGDDRRELSRCLAAWYASGKALDWTANELESGAETKLPSYVFDTERYWVSEHGAAVTHAASARGEALIGTELDVPEDSRLRFETRLSLERNPVLAQHAVLGVPVFPGAGIVQALFALAARCPGVDGVSVLERVELSRPIALAEGREVRLHLVAEEQAGKFALRVFARSAQAEDLAWVSCASALASSTSAGPNRSQLQEPRELVAGMVLVQEDWYTRFERLGLRYGPLFRALKNVWKSESQIVAHVELADVEGSEAAEFGSSVLLDACLHGLLALAGEDLVGPPVPIAFDRIERYGELRGPLWVRADLRSAAGRSRVADLELWAEGGELLLSIQGLQLVEVDRETLARALGTRPFEAYRTGFRPIHLDAAPPQSPASPWILVCPDRAAAEGWRGQARALGLEVVTIVPGTSTGERSGGDYDVDFCERESCSALFAQLATRHAEPAGMICLPRASFPASADSMLEATYSELRQRLPVLQAFLDRYGGSSVPLAICTQGALSVLERDGVRLSLAESVLGGLARAIATEYPNTQCVQLDLELDVAAPSLASLLHAVAASAGSGALAFRDGRCHVAEVQRFDGLADDGRKFALREDATYLITGGTGALGVELTKFLASRGARHIVLASRRASERQTELAGLAGPSVSIHALSADVSSLPECRALLAEIDAGMPPLRGVFHAAGVLADGAFTQLDWPRVETTLAAKVQGAWHLHELTKGRSLDHFVLFSSLASLIGSAGQANYVAANAFLDALAQRRRAEGQHALSINWGPWAEIGMAASADRLGHLGRLGIDALAPKDALASLGKLLHASARLPAQIGVAHVDWPRLADARGSRLPDLTLAPLLGTAAVRQIEHGSDGSPLLARDLLGMPAARARETITEDFFQRVVRVLRIDGRRRAELQARFDRLSLNELGLDSLMAVELRNRILGDLEVDVPIHYFIGASNVSEIVELVHRQTMLKQLLLRPEPQQSSDAEQEEFVL